MSNYTLINWKNGPSGRTKLKAANLNHMDNQIKANSESTEANAEAISQNTEDISKNTAAIEELESKPTSAMLLESASPLEYATNNNIVGLYAEGKSEQYISPNLFNPYIGTMVGFEFTKQNDGGIRIKGTSTQTAFARMSALIPNGTYALSYKISGSRSGNMHLRVRDANGTIIPYASLTISTSATEASTSREMNGGAFTEITVEAGTYDCVIYPMLNSGSTALPYEPYTGTPSPTNPIAIKDASGVIVAHTINLFDENTFSMQILNAEEYVEYKSNAITLEGNVWDEQWELGAYDVTNGNKTVNTQNIRNANPIPIVPNAKYTFIKPSNAVVRVVFYNANKGFLSYIVDATLGRYEFTSPSNAYYMSFYYGGTSYNNDTAIIRGSVKDYISYADSMHIDLRSIPNTNIADTLTVNEDGSAEWVQKVGVYVVNADSTIASSNKSYAITGILTPTPKIYPNSDKSNIICDRMTTDTANNTYNGVNENTISGFNSDNWYFRFYSSSFTSASDCKNKMMGATIYYELATPIVHTLTKEQVDAIRQLKTYEGTTLVDAELQNVKVKYAGDTKKYIDNKDTFPVIKTAKLEPIDNELLIDKKAKVVITADGEDVNYNLNQYLSETYRVITSIQKSGVATDNRIKEITSHSEDETNVGSWIVPNIKLYRVVALVDTPNVANLDAVIFDDVNLLMHEVKSITGTFHKDDNDYPINYYVDGSHYCRTWASREGIKMNVQGFTNCPCEIIIEYIRKADAVSAASVDESVVPMNAEEE